MRTYLLFLPLWLIAGACLAQSPTIDKIRKSGTITLGYVEGAIPFSFIRDAKPEGYSVELCERIAGDLRQQLKLPKLETRWVALTIQNRLDAVRQGKVDLECSTTSRTLSRQQLVDFSLLIYVDGASILVRNDDKLARLSDFGGKKISVIAGTTTERAMKALLAKMRLDTQLVTVASRAEGLALLDKNAVDGFVSDRVALFAAGLTSPNAASYRLLNDLYTIEAYALPMRRGDADFRLAVDRALAGLYRDGGIGEIYSKWFGKLGDPPGLLEALYVLQGFQE
jgi:ABC-type amino acid transport substrate-binding protein